MKKLVFGMLTVVSLIASCNGNKTQSNVSMIDTFTMDTTSTDTVLNDSTVCPD